MVGVPANLKHAMISLPHAYAPRLDAAIHLRTQFQSFEQSVGSDDGARWTAAVKERDDWLNCSNGDCGKQLFKTIADRLLEEMPNIRGISHKAEHARRALLHNAQQGVDAALLASYHKKYPLTPMDVREAEAEAEAEKEEKEETEETEEEEERGRGGTDASASASDRSRSSSRSSSKRDRWNKPSQRRLDFELPTSSAPVPTAGAGAGVGGPGRPHGNPLSDEQEEKAIYTPGGKDGKIYVYIASDNEVVKEAMAAYLRQHADIAVMRVKNNAEIAHAKNLNYLRSVGNHSGVLDLALDWYGLSLSNVVFAWRRGTSFISTFAHSAQRLSGNTEKSSHKSHIGHGIGSRGLSLYFGKNGQPIWRYFY